MKYYKQKNGNRGSIFSRFTIHEKRAAETQDSPLYLKWSVLLPSVCIYFTTGEMS